MRNEVNLFPPRQLCLGCSVMSTNRLQENIPLVVTNCSGECVSIVESSRVGIF